MEIEVAIHEAREPVAVMSIKGNVDASNYVEVINQAQEIYKRPVHNLLLDLRCRSSAVPGWWPSIKFR